MVSSVIAFPDLLRESRQSKGMSQLDLALLAGTTQRRVSFIERGRERPGRDVVLRLAESLDLTLRERNAMLLAAEYAPAFPESSFEGAELASLRRTLQEFCDAHALFPSMITDANGFIVAQNRAFSVFTRGCAPRLLEPPVHAVRIALHPEGMAPRIANFEVWAPRVLRSLARSLQRKPDPRAAELLEELRGYVGDRPSHGQGSGFAIPLEYRTDFGVLQLIATYTQFPSANDVTLMELRVETFLPVDPASHALLEKLHRLRTPDGTGPA